MIINIDNPDITPEEEMQDPHLYAMMQNPEEADFNDYSTKAPNY